MSEKTIYAVLKSFPLGINSYVDPLLLPQNQLSFATNATVRGNFVTQRPNFFNLTLVDNTGGDFQTGIFQGACYFRNTTNGYIMCAVNGKLFQISINAASTVATVIEVPIPQQNSTTAVKNALWQSEQFLIWSDGISLPTFFDGSTSRLSLGSTPTPLGSTATDFNIPAQNQFVIGSEMMPAGNVDINAPWTSGQRVVLIGSALYYVAGWSGGGTTANAKLGLAALTSAGGLEIPVNTEAYLNSKYCGVILDAYGSDGITTITDFPPEPVGGTPGDQLVLTILSPASIAANTIPMGNAVASSRYYQGVVVSASQSVYPPAPVAATGATQITVSIATNQILCPPYTGSGLPYPIYSGGNVSVDGAYSCSVSGYTNSGGNPTFLTSLNITPPISATGVTATSITFPGNAYSSSRTVSILNPQVMNGGTPYVPNYFYITLSQNYSGSIGDTMSVNGITFKVVNFSGAYLTCQMPSGSAGIGQTIPIGALAIDSTQPLVPLVTYGTAIIGGGVVPAAENNLTLDITAANIPVPGQIVYFTTNLTGGGTATVAASVVSASGGTFGGNTNYFNLNLSSAFTNSVGDTLVIKTAAAHVASFVVTAKNVGGSANMIQCQMNTAAAVGDVIPISGSTPSSVSNVVVDTTVGAGVLTGVGVITAGGTGTTNSAGSTGSFITINTPANFQLVTQNNLANQSQIVQVTISGTDYPFWVISVTGGSSGGNNSLLLQNINDTPGLQNVGTAAAPSAESIQNFVPAGTFIYSIPEIPACIMGVYGMGRNWVALPDGVSYVASDIVGSDTGSQQYKYRDSVLAVSQNYFLAGGGTFQISGAGETITAMQFVAQIDASLGQGALQIFTDDTVFSNDAPPDLTTWSNLTSPIQVEGLIGSGAAGQDAVVQSNNDLIFRLSDGGVQSMLMASQDFNQWGNTPISNEVIRSIAGDNQALLSFTSMTVFNNRMLMTCQLVQDVRGVYGAALVALNFDPISSLQGKASSVWDGEWNGLQVLKLITGFFTGVKQCFAICLNGTGASATIGIVQIELDGAATLDNNVQPVTWSFESPMLFKEPEKPTDPRLYKRLVNGEFSIRDITANVGYQVFYRSDQNPNWTPWYSSTVLYQGASDPGYRRRIPIGMPDPKVFDLTNNQPMREGYNFQLKFVLTGSCTLTNARIAADVIPEPEFAKPT